MQIILIWGSCFCYEKILSVAWFQNVKDFATEGLLFRMNSGHFFKNDKALQKRVKITTQNLFSLVLITQEALNPSQRSIQYKRLSAHDDALQERIEIWESQRLMILTVSYKKEPLYRKATRSLSKWMVRKKYLVQ